MSETNARDLSNLAEKAKSLEGRIHQTHTLNQLREIAQEAAKSYHILAAQLMTISQNDKKQLTDLSRKFSQIENEALMKFYGRGYAGPTVPIL